ncbi:nitroreductase family protein [Streptomyces sp. PA03-5A]|nr:nitroreductase family protein [Streptomyces sp. PA03-5A]
MDVYEALYTTRIMRHEAGSPPDGEPVPDPGRRHPGAQRRQHATLALPRRGRPRAQGGLAELYASCRQREYADIEAGRLGTAPHEDPARRAKSLGRIKSSGDHFVEHFAEIPLLVFVFAVDDHGGANIYPAIWSSLLAAGAEGIGGVLTTVLRYEADTVRDLLGVPTADGWRMIAMLAFGYPLGRWGVAANRRPVHEVSSRNRWGASFGARVPEPLWPPDADGARIELDDPAA